LAKATAQAVSYAYVDCQVSDGGYVCASADTSISVWVQAVARAWAGLWAAGIQCDDKCFVEIEAVVDSVGTILVDAATEAYAFLCGGTSLMHLHLNPLNVFFALLAGLYAVLARHLLGGIPYYLGLLLASDGTGKTPFYFDASCYWLLHWSDCH
jgi:hypothetical protein